jgi:hypothetical protein
MLQVLNRISSELSGLGLQVSDFTPLSNRTSLPRTGGIYIAFDAERVLYIGVSRNMKSRWASHSKKKDFDRIEAVVLAWVVMSSADDRSIFEKRLIDIFRPPFNDIYVPRPPKPTFQPQTVDSTNQYRSQGLITAKEFAKLTGAAGSTVRLWLRQGKLGGAKLVTTQIGPMWYIPESLAHNFVKRNVGRPPK